MIHLFLFFLCDCVTRASPRAGIARSLSLARATPARPVVYKRVTTTSHTTHESAVRRAVSQSRVSCACVSRRERSRVTNTSSMRKGTLHYAYVCVRISPVQLQLSLILMLSLDLALANSPHANIPDRRAAAPWPRVAASLRRARPHRTPARHVICCRLYDFLPPC